MTYTSNKKTKLGRTLDTEWHNMWQEDNLGSTLTGLAGGLSGAIGSGLAASQIKDTANIEMDIESIGNTQFSTGNFDNLMAQYNTNNMANTSYTKDDFLAFTPEQQVGNVLLSGISGFTGTPMNNKFASGGLIMGGVNALANMVGTGIGIASSHRKATQEAERLNALAEEANQRYLNNFNNAVSNTQNTLFNNSLLNISSYGGPLFNLGGDFNNGLIFVDEGGTHEQNPFDGVLMGVDNEGTPNLVEEGEIIWNDYVFSNRLKPTKKLLAEGGFSDKYNDWTFAKIVEDLQKESSERPNDIISKAGLEDMMNRMITMQETVRVNKEKRKNNFFKYGGPKGNMLSGPGKDSNLLETPVLEEETEEDILAKIAAESAMLEANANAKAAAIGAKAQAEVDKIRKNTDDTYGIGFFDWTQGLKTDSLSQDLKGLNDVIKDSTNTNIELPWQAGLRYASPIIHGINLLNNLKKPDYSAERSLIRKASSIPGGSYTPLGDYLNLQKVDQNMLVNPILANAASTRRAIQNQATDPRAALLANNYLTNKAIGESLIQGIQANNTIESQEAQFNRGTNQSNSQMGLQALAMDQQKAQLELNTLANAISSMQKTNAAGAAAIGAESGALADDLGAIGREAIDRSMLRSLIDSGALQWRGKNGGMLTRRRK